MRNVFTRATLWQDPNLRWLWSGQTISIFGDRVTDIALPWLILTQTHAPLVAALVAAARYIPMLALGLVAGPLADLLPRRALLIASDLLRAGALGVIVNFGLQQRMVPIGTLVMVALFMGIGQVFFQSAYRAWLPDLTDAATLGRANAALEASDAVGTIAGPTLGGALIQMFGPALALGADLLSYLVSAATLWRVQPTAARYQAPLRWREIGGAIRTFASEPRRTVQRGTKMLPARLRQGTSFMNGGIAAIWRSPDQRLLKGLTAVLALYAGTIGVLLATLTQSWLRLSPWEAGLIYASAGVGGLLGSVLAPHVLDLPWRRALLGTLLVAAIGAAGLLCAALRADNPFLLAIIANAVIDGAVALSFIITTTQIALITPPHVRGRVSALGVSFGALMRGLGLVLIGVLAQTGNPVPALTFLMLAFGGAALAAARRPTTHPDSLADHSDAAAELAS